MNKTSGGDGISTELFKIPEDDALKLPIMPAKLENSAVTTGLEKITFCSSTKEGQCQKHSNYYTIHLISYSRKIMFKISSYVSMVCETRITRCKSWI